MAMLREFLEIFDADTGMDLKQQYEEWCKKHPNAVIISRTFSTDSWSAIICYQEEVARPAQKECFPEVNADEPFKLIRDRWLDHLERTYLRAMMGRHGRDTSAIAAASGLDRSYVYRVMRKHEL